MTQPHEHQHNERREDRGREAREPETGAYSLAAFTKRGGPNLNTLILTLLMAGGGVGGVGIWRSSGGVGEKLDKNAADLASMAKTQQEVSSKVDTMTTLFTQVLTSQGKLEAAQVTLAKSQDDLRVEIASLKASGTEGKVRDMDMLLRKQGEDIAELRALLRERK